MGRNEDYEVNRTRLNAVLVEHTIQSAENHLPAERKSVLEISLERGGINGGDRPKMQLQGDELGNIIQETL